MAEPSTFTQSIKFYDRMSQLQGDLSTYQSQQFQLEEDYHRLWSQGARPSSSTQLQEEGRRRARNQAILDKLQQLEGNVSIFAARSERLRLMKNEYESLVRKYGNEFKRRSVHFSEIPTSSVGVNTEITGPILAGNEIPSPSGDEPSKGNLNIDVDTWPAPPPPPALAPTFPEPEQDGNSNANSNIPDPLPVQRVPSFLLDSSSDPVPVTKKPTFLDISSSSSDEEEGEKEKRVEELEESSTSVSALMPKKFRGSNNFNMRGFSSEGSVSESTSKIQPQPRNPITERKAGKDVESESESLANDNDNTSQIVGESLDNRAEFGELLNDSEILKNLAPLPENDENINHSKAKKSLAFQQDVEEGEGKGQEDKPERDVEGTSQGQSHHTLPAKEEEVKETGIPHRLWRGGEEEGAGAEVGRHIQFGSKEETSESSSIKPKGVKSPPKIMKKERGADPGKASAGRKLNLKLNYDDSESDVSEKAPQFRVKADEEKKVGDRSKKEDADSLDEFFGF